MYHEKKEEILSVKERRRPNLKDVEVGFLDPTLRYDVRKYTKVGPEVESVPGRPCHSGRDSPVLEVDRVSFGSGRPSLCPTPPPSSGWL